MTALSRREFGTFVLLTGLSGLGGASQPVAALAGVPRRTAAGGVVLGASTYSFRDLSRVTGKDNVDDVIRAIRAAGVHDIELAFTNVEPAPPSTGPFLGGSNAYPRRIVLSPEEVAATNATARTALREWRRQTPTAVFDNVRGKFEAASITVHACALGYDASFTDDEIDATLRQVKALGVSTVSSPMTMATAARLVPFAERHGVTIAIHNQVEGHPSGAIAASALGDALALSPAFRLKLDIGNLTASDADAVSVLRAHQARVSYVLVKDRLRHGGASQALGEGDTPIAAVLGVLKSSPSAIPALVEYDYAGLRSSAEEVAAAVGYMTRVVA